MPADQDNRQQRRLERVQQLFAWDFQIEPRIDDPQFTHIQQQIPFLPQLDQIILRFAPKHQISDFHKMDLAILRQALYELEYTETPPLVVINEAIEIAKEYGSEQSSRFVNGVLGSYWDEKGRHEPTDDQHALAQATDGAGADSSHS